MEFEKEINALKIEVEWWKSAHIKLQEQHMTLQKKFYDFKNKQEDKE